MNLENDTQSIEIALENDTRSIEIALENDTCSVEIASELPESYRDKKMIDTNKNYARIKWHLYSKIDIEITAEDVEWFVASMVHDITAGYKLDCYKFYENEPKSRPRKLHPDLKYLLLNKNGFVKHFIRHCDRLIIYIKFDQWSNITDSLDELLEDMCLETQLVAKNISVRFISFFYYLQMINYVIARLVNKGDYRLANEIATAVVHTSPSSILKQIQKRKAQIADVDTNNNEKIPTNKLTIFIYFTIIVASCVILIIFFNFV